MNRNHLKLPFKRSAIQPVWRADRPQRGRYQEFYQCDADVAGSASLLSEVEFVQIYDQVFAELKLPVNIRINNRKLLQGLIESCQMGDRFEEVAVLIDKLDKAGEEKIRAEMVAKGFDEAGVGQLFSYFGNTALTTFPVAGLNHQALEGLDELRYVVDLATQNGLTNELTFDPTLARGLGYYTGSIFEVVAKEASMGSIGGGGRYDNLTGAFGMPGITGVGISFGAERIYDVMEEKGLFPDELQAGGNLIILFMDTEAAGYAFELASDLRKQGIPCEIYPESAKINKLMSYANERRFTHIALIGLDEMKASKVTLKNMLTGDQDLIGRSEIPTHI